MASAHGLQHVTAQHVKQRLLAADLSDCDFFNETIILGLHTCCLEEHEKARLLAGSAEPGRVLNRAEQFLMDLEAIPSLHLKIGFLHEYLFMDEAIDETEHAIQTAIAAMHELLHCGAFHVLLHLILVVGNCLNDGKQQRACGFQLRTLPKLDLMRVTPSQQPVAEGTLLDYIAHKVIELDLQYGRERAGYVPMASVAEQMPHVMTVAKGLDPALWTTCLTKIQDRVKVQQAALEACSEDENEKVYNKLHASMNQFLRQRSERVAALQVHQMELQQTVVATLDYFGEKHGKEFDENARLLKEMCMDVSVFCEQFVISLKPLS